MPSYQFSKHKNKARFTDLDEAKIERSLWHRRTYKSSIFLYFYPYKLVNLYTNCKWNIKLILLQIFERNIIKFHLFKLKGEY